MTRDEGVSLIQEQLAFRTTLSSNIITAMKLAQTMLEASPTKPWFLVSEDSYANTTPSESRIAIPSDMLEETDEAVLRYLPDDVSAETPERDLKKDDYDTLRKNYMNTTTGTIKTGPPEAYALLGNYFRIFPTPDDYYTLHMIYYMEDDLLTTNVENGWLKYVPYLLLGKAGKHISLGPLRDQMAWQVFDSWEKQGAAILMAKTISRDLANKELQIGGPH